MANDVQKVVAESVTSSPKTYSNLNSFSVLNNSAEILSVSADGGNNFVDLNTGQTMSLQASTGFVLPDIVLSGTNINAQVIYT